MPWKHEWLEAQTGIARPTITMYCTGARNLGIRNGRKIAAALDVTLADLGGPINAEEEPESQFVADRLARLEAWERRLRQEYAPFVESTVARLAALEAALENGAPLSAPRSSDGHRRKSPESRGSR